MNEETSKNEAASQGDREGSAGFPASEAGTAGRPEKEPQALKPARTTPENGETVKQPAPKKPEQKTKLEQKPQTLEDAATVGCSVRWWGCTAWRLLPTRRGR